MAALKLRAVTFDFGWTLAELDTVMLAGRLAEIGAVAAAAAEIEALARRLDAGGADAVRAYSVAIKAGHGGHPWKLLMTHLLSGAGVAAEQVARAVDFLWDQQPTRNLWRRPVPGMIELVQELRGLGVPVGVISNSEGHLAELARELGWLQLFDAFADSGKLGMEKPGREIFEWTAERLGVQVQEMVHVGDAWAADVEGALGAGAHAVWFGGDAEATLPERVRVCRDAAAVRRVLVGWGVIEG